MASGEGVKYCNICGKELNSNGFCDDPECKSIEKAISLMEHYIKYGTYKSNGASI